ncbi:PEP-CTERM sorting domain-containing protein [Thalassotalea sp. PS06]|uniref:PEP-CTERM sorting domain-containing protein n=1 Tax=Thalassotalea sp. PS06 TaxID=2594005 RepID=UPI001165A3BA|nr:PEP-CTERM sorting domain-containing protein [Thalassotalea sp. PS06]QDP02101.1 PEP-CTERM sorting domain-containing protein [Thalassotalea sp. PS06]
MKLLSKFLTAGLLAFSFSGANAAVVEGQSDFIENEDGSLTLIFDLVSADIDGEGDGLMFTYVSEEAFFTVELLVTGGGIVVQDYPADGGLGLYNGADGDNLAGGESLTFEFPSLGEIEFINLVSISFNGLIVGDGHQELADGMVTVNGFSVDASDFSLTGQGMLPDGGLVKSFDVSATADFTGYVESITFFIEEDPQGIPEPGTILLMLSGLLGARFIKYRK